MSTPKFLKKYIGVVTGSFAGRDDGQPETKYEFYSSVEELAKNFGTKVNEQYFELVNVNHEMLTKIVTEIKEKEQEREKEVKVKIEEIDLQILKLQEEKKELLKGEF